MDATDPRLRLEDVDGNGLDDLVQVGASGTSIWLNEGGQAFTNEHFVNLTANPMSWSEYIRTADINGSGTRDVFYGEANQYRYIDLTGGVRPWLLTRIANGMGKTTAIEYSTSTAMIPLSARGIRGWRYRSLGAES
ncbi:VCBS repeat-containing protein [Pendulispora rubella]|uniref:VCBS repeat-containing protein n=1 Tax=Pendulispora rubella TaxID=2741070 RepID=A0ABZ2LNY0_9BACT